MTSLRSRQIQASGWVALTTFVLLFPGQPDDGFSRWLPQALEPYADKLVHALLFGVLVLLLDRATASDHRSRSRLSWILGSAALLVIVLELAQRWVPFRSVDWMDAAAGLTGILISAAAVSPKYR